MIYFHRGKIRFTNRQRRHSKIQHMLERAKYPVIGKACKYNFQIVAIQTTANKLLKKNDAI